MNAPTAPAAGFDILLLMFGNVGAEAASSTAFASAAGSSPTSVATGADESAVSFASLLNRGEITARRPSPVEPFAPETKREPLENAKRRGVPIDALCAALCELPIGQTVQSPLAQVEASPGTVRVESTPPSPIQPSYLAADAHGPLRSLSESPLIDSASRGLPEFAAPSHLAHPIMESPRPPGWAAQFDDAPEEIDDPTPALDRRAWENELNNASPGRNSDYGQTSVLPQRHVVARDAMRVAAHDVSHAVTHLAKQIANQTIGELARREVRHSPLAILRPTILLRTSRPPGIQPNAVFPVPPSHTTSAMRQSPIMRIADLPGTPESAALNMASSVPDEVEATQATHLESPAVIDELDSISMRLHESDDRAIIDLALPELGTVQIEVSSVADDTVVALHADPPMHLLIRENLHEFVAALSESGIELASFDLRQDRDREPYDVAAQMLTEFASGGGPHERFDTTSEVRTGLARYRLMSVTA